jgi:hypothetical protein
MENKIMNEINSALKSLDSVADSFGAARATHIAILGNHLLAIRESALTMQTELDKLRRSKEEHIEHDDKSNEVSAES